MKRNILAVIGCCLCCVCCFGCAIVKAPMNLWEKSWKDREIHTVPTQMYQAKTDKDSEFCIPYRLKHNGKPHNDQIDFFSKYEDGYLLIKPPSDKYSKAEKESYYKLNKILENSEEFGISTIRATIDGDNEISDTIRFRIYFTKIPDIKVAFETEMNDYSSKIIPPEPKNDYWSHVNPLLAQMINKAWQNEFKLGKYFHVSDYLHPVAWIDSNGGIIRDKAQFAAAQNEYLGMILKVSDHLPNTEIHGVRYIRLSDNILKFLDIGKTVASEYDDNNRCFLVDNKVTYIKQQNISDWHVVNYPFDIIFYSGENYEYVSPLWQRVVLTPILLPINLALNVALLPIVLICPQCAYIMR